MEVNSTENTTFFSKSQTLSNVFSAASARVPMSIQLHKLIQISAFSQKKVTSRNNQTVLQEYFVSAIDPFKLSSNCSIKKQPWLRDPASKLFFKHILVAVFSSCPVYRIKSLSKTKMAGYQELSGWDAGAGLAIITAAQIPKFKYYQGKIKRYCTQFRVTIAKKAYFFHAVDAATAPISSTPFSTI